MSTDADADAHANPHKRAKTCGHPLIDSETAPVVESGAGSSTDHSATLWVAGAVAFMPGLGITQTMQTCPPLRLYLGVGSGHGVGPGPGPGPGPHHELFLRVEDVCSTFCNVTPPPSPATIKHTCPWILRCAGKGVSGLYVALRHLPLAMPSVGTGLGALNPPSMQAQVIGHMVSSLQARHGNTPLLGTGVCIDRVLANSTADTGVDPAPGPLPVASMGKWMRAADNSAVGPLACTPTSCLRCPLGVPISVPSRGVLCVPFGAAAPGKDCVVTYTTARTPDPAPFEFVVKFVPVAPYGIVPCVDVVSFAKLHAGLCNLPPTDLARAIIAGATPSVVHLNVQMCGPFWPVWAFHALCSLVASISPTPPTFSKGATERLAINLALNLPGELRPHAAGIMEALLRELSPRQAAIVMFNVALRHPWTDSEVGQGGGASASAGAGAGASMGGGSGGGGGSGSGIAAGIHRAPGSRIGLDAEPKDKKRSRDGKCKATLPVPTHSVVKTCGPRYWRTAHKKKASGGGAPTAVELCGACVVFV